MSFLRAGVVAGIACAASISHAQSIGPVSIETEGWAYVPVLSDTNQDVEAIVALRVDDPDAAISALFCERDAAGNWRAEAWGDVTSEEVAAAVFDSLGLQVGDPALEDMFWDWPVEIDETAFLNAMAAPIAPVSFGDGVALGDPFEQIVQVYPEVLDPLESSGYPAVSTLSGSAITGGTFTTPVGPPQPIDDDCLRASELLDALHAGFSASAVDGDLVDSAFEAASLVINSNCTCRVRTTRTLTPWVYTCGPWSQISGPTGVGTDCRYKFKRSVSGTRSRIHKRTNADCSTDKCTQTCAKTGFQERGTFVIRLPGGGCPANGPIPAAVVACGCDFFACSTGPWTPDPCAPWIPVVCP